jgi:glutamate-5-semialdehyde dehydrogenase
MGVMKLMKLLVYARERKVREMGKVMEILGKSAKVAAAEAGKLGISDKNRGLLTIADELVSRKEFILEENRKDLKLAEERGVSVALIDRLRLTEERIKDIALGLREIAKLDDPVGNIEDMKVRPNGLRVGKMRVPLGVIGIIYESRPNVTADAFGLCFKAGNAVILRGGSDAINSNLAIVEAIKSGLKKENLPEDIIQLVEDTSRETATKMMSLNEYIDVLIPRGGTSLIESVVNNSTIPVIETGTGNCHVYVDAFADVNMAVSIIENAKTQRLGVCNTCESLVIHKGILKEVLVPVVEVLKKHDIEMRGDEAVVALEPDVLAACEEDWGMEYLDRIISIKTVDSIEEGIEHINTYNSGHSEAIVTNDYHNALKFQKEIDSAAVYVNASTRFTDGFEFGLGAEIGISTQKLHARGPMGLNALTTTKFIIFGDGQIRR